MPYCTVLLEAVQLMRVEPALAEMPWMPPVPPLPSARHDSSTAPGPAMIPLLAQLLTARSRKAQPRAWGEGLQIPIENPLIDPLRTVARWLALRISIPRPPLKFEI